MPIVSKKLLSPTVTDSRPEQPEKVYSPIEVTLPGMKIDLREEQPEKAELPIEATLSGMKIDSREEQL